MEFFSPLRYPGGKSKVSTFFKKLYRENNLYDGVYVEPFAGGASVALSLLFNEYASKVIINDKDFSISAFWQSVIYETESLCKLIYDTPITIEVWEKQKEIQKQKEKYNCLEVAFATFFLNRTNRSGIISAGVIGGKKQKGSWKMDARYNKKDLIKRIKKIGEYRNRIEVFNLDATDLINSLKDNLSEKTLFYFDPPYFIKGKDLYLNYFKEEDHKKISESISKIIKQKWVVTYDNVKEISDLYNRFRQVNFSLRYSAGKSSIGQEVMIFSDNLREPDASII